MVMDKPTGDYQTAFNTQLAVNKSERLQEALGLKSQACAFCYSVYPTGSMIRRDRRYFCNRIHAAYYHRVRKAEVLALAGEDENALSVKGLGEALENLRRFDDFPSLSMLLADTVDYVETRERDGLERVNETVYGEGRCIMCGNPTARSAGAGRPAKFDTTRCRVAYSRLKKAIVTGTVAELIAEPEDDVADVQTVEPIAVETEEVKRAYRKASAYWNRRPFGVLDWSAEAFKPILITGNGDHYRARCKCGSIFGLARTGSFAACVRWAEMHTTELRVHAKNMQRQRNGGRLAIMRRVRNAENVRAWDGFVIGQRLNTAWEIN